MDEQTRTILQAEIERQRRLLAIMRADPVRARYLCREIKKRIAYIICLSVLLKPGG